MRAPWKRPPGLSLFRTGSIGFSLCVSLVWNTTWGRPSFFVCLRRFSGVNPGSSRCHPTTKKFVALPKSACVTSGVSEVV
jgi:hypothetical protein